MLNAVCRCNYLGTADLGLGQNRLNDGVWMELGIDIARVPQEGVMVYFMPFVVGVCVGNGLCLSVLTFLVLAGIQLGLVRLVGEIYLLALLLYIVTWKVWYIDTYSFPYCAYTYPTSFKLR